jgi:hypothetical protein
MNEFTISTDNPIFEELSKEYITHTKGLFILAPSGVGKSFYVNNQKDKHWLDGDYLWEITGADYLGDEWENDFDKVQDVNKRSDIVTKIAKENGFWILGSSNYDLKPDAIVLPDWEVHRERIAKREQSHYDGGAKSDDLNGVLKHREWINEWAKKGVLKFSSIEEAVEFLKNESN